MTTPPHTGTAAEAAFFKRLQQVTTRIHDTDHLEQIMLETSADICQLLGADRFTLYVVNDDRSAIVSKVKTGLNTARELKLPIGPQSIAGFVALTQRTLNIADVYDDAELKRLDPRLTFLKEVDRRSGYRTCQMLIAPIARSGELQGVFQLVNRPAGGTFSQLEQEGVQQLCETLSAAIRQRMAPPQRAAVLTSRYHGLVADGIVTADELTQCVQTARAQSVPVEKALMSELGVTAAQLGSSMARFFQTIYLPFDAKRLRSDALQGKLKREFVQTHHWIPLEDTPEGLLVMTLDPEDVRNSRIVQQVFPQFAKCVYAVTTVAEFEQTVEQFWGAQAVEGSVEDMLADLVPVETEAESVENNLATAAQDNELVKFVNKVIVDAYRQGASDIHFEPLPGKAKAGIRFRIDGSLQPYAEVPASYRDAIVARLKIMCDLDISEKRKPQDGKIKFKKYGPLDIELRVATLPSAGGVEDVVMRILAAGEPIPLEKLGLTQHNRERLEATVSKPYGLFYVCGPTGSGKTTTLHSILKYLNTPETKIWTAEDPVEITQKGLRQVQVNKKAGIDFAMVMRAFLRADPDIIMVGESRDKETVSMGVEASLTGHLVFSTLHTNSAPESITRLLDMGMDPFNFADALLGILAQRLAKRLCDCKEAYKPDSAEVKSFIKEYAQDLMHTLAWRANPGDAAQGLLADWSERYGQDGELVFYRAKGCDTCRGTGYKGRVGLHELLVADDLTRKLIQERARVAELFTACVEGGMRSLKMDGMEKVLMGLTDLKQVRAVCIK
ncbi:MAG TPA: GspE/PulE family protein [Burkholderiaceae bacterium]|nr:GspE/PulE family protein [Burkholderiaceae bacterium]